MQTGTARKRKRKARAIKPQKLMDVSRQVVKSHRRVRRVTAETTIVRLNSIKNKEMTI
jgi:hypothetical protein